VVDFDRNGWSRSSEYATAEFLGDIVEPVVDDIGATLATRDRRIRESGLVDTA
jgi:hypothetical protein